ncbi:MAG: hypothetical protein P9M13_00220 [Candidatus Ancaeobacter aquaticus]|nr:hypothetical protein [Candidatus Ancaeobacter aquaticus]
MYNDDAYEEDELMDYVEDFEDALREIIDDLPEFKDLMDFLKNRHGNIALYMGVQVVGDKGKKKQNKRSPKDGKIRRLPIQFEFTQNDKKFLKSLHIDCDI